MNMFLALRVTQAAKAAARRPNNPLFHVLRRKERVTRASEQLPFLDQDEAYRASAIAYANTSYLWKFHADAPSFFVIRSRDPG